MQDSNTVTTPLIPKFKLTDSTAEKHASVAAFPYKEMIGCLNHAEVHTRPDISHTVSALAQFSTSYGETHCTSLKHLLRHIEVTLSREIFFRQTSKPSRLLKVFADAKYANEVVTRSSTTGYTISIGGSFVCWWTRCQCSFALSTTESEYISISDCSKHVFCFKNPFSILTHLIIPAVTIHMPPSEGFDNTPTKIFNDNNGVVFLSEESTINSRSKHIDTRFHYVRELVWRHVIKVTQIATTKMPAEYVTKATGKSILDHCRVLMEYLDEEEVLRPKVSPTPAICAVEASPLQQNKTMATLRAIICQQMPPITPSISFFK